MIQEGFAVSPLKGCLENIIFCFAIIMVKLDNVRMRHTYISCLLTVGYSLLIPGIQSGKIIVERSLCYNEIENILRKYGHS